MDRSTDIAHRHSWRGWFIFLSVFSIFAAGSLYYVQTRPAVYRSALRLEISPASTVAEADQIRPPSLQAQPAAFLTEAQTITSRPVIEEAIARLKRAGGLKGLGAEPADTAQQLLRAEPVEQTQVVQLSAEGPQKDVLWRLVNAVADTYRDHTAQQYALQISGNYDDLKEEVDKLHQQVIAKRAEVDSFRTRNNIVSLERNENGVLAQIDNLSRSYSTSLEDLAKAQGHLQAMRNATAKGAALVGGKDDPTLAALEQQAATLRDQLTALRRRFTPDYLALDSDAMALSERIAGLERQIVTQRAATQQSALAAAEEELETSQAQVNRLRGEIADNQKNAQQFAARLALFKSMQEDLDHLENIERLTADRLTKSQASERESAPKVEILERAVPSLKPIRPDYTTNSAIAVAGSFAIGIFAVWFARFVAGPVQPAIAFGSPLPVEHSRAQILSPVWIEPPQLTARDKILNLLPGSPAPRELEDGEIAALTMSAAPPVVLACLGLLSGLTAGELIALDWSHIDFDTRAIRVSGESCRNLELDEPLLTLLQRRQREDSSAPTLLHNAQGGPWTMDDLNREILCAAYDAGLSRPDEITPAVLRHTWLVWLFRQGIRAIDVSRIAGNIPGTDFVRYTRLGAGASRVPLSEIDRVHPAVRNLAQEHGDDRDKSSGDCATGPMQQSA